jgi:hypothetical protein
LPSWPGKSAKRVFALDVPAIHVLIADTKDVDAWHKAGHDERGICESCTARGRAASN